MLHSSASSASPSQSRPPFSGAGLSQVLSRVLLPPPQGTLQFVHGDHSLQVPFTTTAGSKMEFPEASGYNSWQSYIIPGQDPLLHSLKSMFPRPGKPPGRQSAPPHSGAGLSQLLILVSLPAPQVVEQVVQLDHMDHCPSIA